MKIVIVEDDRGIREALTLLFADAAYEVSIYSSARDLLFNGFELPDVFLIDWLLPDINGLELCKRLKADPISRHIPVAIMTAAQHSYLSSEAMEAGADALVNKPFKKSELLALLQGLIPPANR